MSEILISIREVCERYGLSDSTIRRHVRNGKLPAYRVGPRLLKFDPADIDAVLVRPTSSDAAARAAEKRVDDYIDRILASAPPLTEEQRTRLAELLRPARLPSGQSAARTGGQRSPLEAS